MDFNPLIPKNFIEELTRNGRFTKIRFIRYNLPKDIADAYKKERYEETKKIEGTSEYTIQPSRNQNFPAMVRDWAIETISDGSKIGNMAEVIGQKYDSVKMEIDVGGRKRTINLNRLESLKTDIDITETVRTNEGGHPEFSSIDAAATELLDSILAELGVRSTNVKQN